jgi:hypothetical protein
LLAAANLALLLVAEDLGFTGLLPTVVAPLAFIKPSPVLIVGGGLGLVADCAAAPIANTAELKVISSMAKVVNGCHFVFMIALLLK